jgi:hypothetical protein
MSAPEGLRLANTLIKGTVYEDELIGWKKKYLRENWNKDCNIGAVGKTYCNNFLKCNPQLREKRSSIIESSHDQVMHVHIL